MGEGRSRFFFALFCCFQAVSSRTLTLRETSDEKRRIGPVSTERLTDQLSDDWNRQDSVFKKIARSGHHLERFSLQWSSKEVHHTYVEYTQKLARWTDDAQSGVTEKDVEDAYAAYLDARVAHEFLNEGPRFLFEAGSTFYHAYQEWKETGKPPETNKLFRGLLRPSLDLVLTVGGHMIPGGMIVRDIVMSALFPSKSGTQMTLEAVQEQTTTLLGALDRHTKDTVQAIDQSIQRAWQGLHEELQKQRLDPVRVAVQSLQTTLAAHSANPCKGVGGEERHCTPVSAVENKLGKYVAHLKVAAEEFPFVLLATGPDVLRQWLAVAVMGWLSVNTATEGKSGYLAPLQESLVSVASSLTAFFDSLHSAVSSALSQESPKGGLSLLATVLADPSCHCPSPDLSDSGPLWATDSAASRAFFDDLGERTIRHARLLNLNVSPSALNCIDPFLDAASVDLKAVEESCDVQGFAQRCEDFLQRDKLKAFLGPSGQKQLGVSGLECPRLPLKVLQVESDDVIPTVQGREGGDMWGVKERKVTSFLQTAATQISQQLTGKTDGGPPSPFIRSITRAVVLEAVGRVQCQESEGGAGASPKLQWQREESKRVVQLGPGKGFRAWMRRS
uniref:Cullin N-terminal domain-containing protein n=1 Tax=Chromera velia CCMP2878 TaxID=1169474 RepID=A0A0G4GX62_9ALVE|eukprot:Cvel_5353.t1-p1 / transcript=Cvel_5353.t1 / gene=Cvel_5353 / organism=Chromera_velia_CCMP2878 / gene_product=hypothetical protein / transcript_product=hypothetical protein / location=Cvel_scaffold248:56327-58830(+) / protein_length=616 / sequence_SO=supercontig / SO=protein_coding / is_pseudo=false